MTGAGRVRPGVSSRMSACRHLLRRARLGVLSASQEVDLVGPARSDDEAPATLNFPQFHDGALRNAAAPTGAVGVFNACGRDGSAGRKIGTSE